MHPSPLARGPPPTTLVAAAPSSSYVDPIQTNAHPGPSQSQFASAPPLRKTPSNSSKRRRALTPDLESGADSAASHGQTQRKNRDGPKKKKANRACFHCQKAHLTCDDSRPCQRCVKRGIGSNCTEGHRKKAKYLLDEEELEQLKRSKSSAPENTSEAPATSAQPPTSAPTLPPMQSSEPFPPSDPLFNVSFDPNFSFGSEAANLEYSILSAILGTSSPPDNNIPNRSPSPSQAQYSSNIPAVGANSAWPSESYIGGLETGYVARGGTEEQQQMAIQPSATTLSGSAAMSSTFMSSFPTQYPQEQSQSQQDLEFRYPSPQYQQPPAQPQPAPAYMHPLQPRHPLRARSPPLIPVPPSAFFRQQPQNMASPASSGSGSTGSQLQSINDRVTTPYDYTEGYHFLMKHLPTRFEKNDILRIVRALAIFRPSLIALQMPLSEDDEVFVEKCFQRSLLELDKLISFSGTPTVAWRRTGEICLVAPEFCTLTEWAMDELLGRRKYIYELFENQSVVEYWENFATHAFENTTQSVYSHCVLLKPSGAPVPATFCFSIRRDIFDLPSLVIGQWLPLL